MQKKDMNYTEAVEYIESVSWKGSVPGLERISELCGLLGNPEKKVKFVHIAGTNGKGSVSAIVSSVLSAAGYKTGLFTSPHLIDYCERIKIDGKDITHDDFASVVESVREKAIHMVDAPTEFELLTAVAFVYFAKTGCDVAVLECGMGGRLDSTNIIPSPLVSVITNIALDHTSILGDNEIKIAHEKAGIIKESPVVLGALSPNVEKYLIDKCKKDGLKYGLFRDVELENEVLTTDGLRFVYKGNEMLLPLCGEYQKTNLRTAISTIELLRSIGYNITDSSVILGVSKVHWIGRFERICTEPIVIFDGAHNPDGAKYTAETFKALYPNKKAVLVTGVMADKDYRSIAQILSQVASEVFTVKPDNLRALSSSDLADVYSDCGILSHPCSSIYSALKSAFLISLEMNTPILCTGSLYMYAEVLSSVQKLAQSK